MTPNLGLLPPLPFLGSGSRRLGTKAPHIWGVRPWWSDTSDHPWASLGSVPPGVDDAESECGLDQGVTFDWVITNDGDEVALGEQLEELVQSLHRSL